MWAVKHFGALFVIIVIQMAKVNYGRVLVIIYPTVIQYPSALLWTMANFSTTLYSDHI